MKLNPGFPQIKDALEKAHYNLGINYAENGKLNKAIIEFNKTMEINLHYAMLDKNSLNIIGNDKKAISDKRIHSGKSYSGENIYDSTNNEVRKESLHKEEQVKESLQDQMPHQIDIAGEMILAKKGNTKKPEYDQSQVESQHPLLLSQEDNKKKLVQSNKESFETGQLQKADDSRHEKAQLKTEISNEGQGKKQIQVKIAHAKTVDTGETDVNDLDFMDQERNMKMLQSTTLMTTTPFSTWPMPITVKPSILMML